MRNIVFAFSILVCSLPAMAQDQAFNYTVQKSVTARQGAVASAHPLASLAGLKMLQQGGNAVDAAIATQLALAVVYPSAGNLGGGGFLVAHLANGKELAIDYREKAPGRAHRDMYLDDKGAPIVKLSLDGHHAAGVPGTVAGLFASLPYGKLKMAQLIAPAIELADKGFVITAAEARSLNNLRKDFENLNTRPVAFVKQNEWKAGDTLIQKDLARTLRLIRDKGAAGFYQGETADKIVAEMQRGKGIISKADLKAYKAATRIPLRFPYKGYTILTMPLPSSGGVILQQLLGMTEKYPLAQYGFHSIAAVHLMVEAERRAYADRAEFLGDPDFVKVPVKAITQPQYLASRMQDFNPQQASSSTKIKAGQPKESEETTHLSVTDAQGNAVSVTTTLNGGYGSRVVVGGAGFILNNEMDDFSVKPGSPNMYGLLGTEANAIAPGKRMLSSMTPTIVLQGNRPYMVTGTPGGSTIITSMFQTIVNVLDFGLSESDAVNKPKFHHQWQPETVYVEKGFPDSTVAGLKKMGHKVDNRNAIGRVELITIKNGRITAVADNRGDDSAAGY
ncbi:gamma-glutamyltransferase [Chitinophaga horti]|uniref:Glutathione hydrolase proenzyme n=1 Tax=Chitinophaga horti TaxID=2920382 RepID=A0ABY6IUN9_9BACT|nr:gamma-glutamyltransferase [Chitinophaga horti]UYQ91086.1 gamma-glutamyltransferase [Chitinophaga horti]